MNPLALPKATKKLCELCEGRAFLECSQCRVTFYCNVNHLVADWVGIHERICPLLVPIRTPTILSITREKKAELDIKKRELIAIVRSIAVGKLSEGKHEEALPAGQAFLRLCMDVFGSGSVELVPAYLLLGEANLGLGKLSPAAEMLSLAEWIVCRIPECDHEISHGLHRNLGRLQTMRGNLDKALFHFSIATYHAAEAFGLDSTECRYGYFLLANVFAKKGETSNARYLYKEVTQTWHSDLTKAIQPFLENPEMSPLPTIDRQVEVDTMLETMLDFEQSQRMKDHGLIALLQHSRFMMCFMEGDRVKAKGFGVLALQSSQMIPKQELSGAIQRLLEEVEAQPKTSSAEKKQ